MLSDSEAQELLSFLTPSTRPDVKGQATEYVLGLSGTRDGCHWLRSKPQCLRALVTLTSDPSVAVAKDCFHALINLSADETLHRPLVEDAEVLPTLIRNLLDPEFVFADRICTILTNLSRREDTCRAVLQALQAGDQARLHGGDAGGLARLHGGDAGGLARLVELCCTEGYNKTASLHYLGPLLSNLTQLPQARDFILDKDRCVVQRLLPYTQYEASAVRRGGVIGTLRNCCFDYRHHEWLLSDAVDILPFLLLPLAGPEELCEQENEGLPVDLQFLPEDKKREEDPDIRKMLLETLMLLTATRQGRLTLRERQAYPVLRELHRWETEPTVAAACEKLIHVLIGDEPETGMENLMEVEIPEGVERKLREAQAEEEEELKVEREERKEEETEN